MKTNSINHSLKKILAALTCLLFTLSANSQDIKNLAELLGYPKDSKLLIIHADDMGLAQSVNAATIKAFDNNGITAGSIMVPCPWADDIIAYVKDHPGLDVGIHLTMTAEWNHYKWDGITSSDQIASLLDKNGYFYASNEELGKTVKGEEAERELKAQIDKVIASGIRPTHIDTHMGSVLANPELVKIYLSLSDAYNLPILFPRAYLSMFQPDMAKALGKKIFLLDNLFMLDPGMIKDNWVDAYKKGLSEMKPGLNEMIVHLSYDTDEMRAISAGHDDYGSLWRQKDLDMVLSKEFQDLIRENDIILIGWHQIRDLMQKQSAR
jgi:chitin disaccharide deacetylase